MTTSSTRPWAARSTKFTRRPWPDAGGARTGPHRGVGVSKVSRKDAKARRNGMVSCWHRCADHSRHPGEAEREEIVACLELAAVAFFGPHRFEDEFAIRSEDHTADLQSLMRRSYPVSCWEK